MSYFELSSLSTNTGALALAAMGETVVFLLGGIDLSAGATLSLVNVTLASQTGDSFLSQVAMVLIGARDRRLWSARSMVFLLRTCVSKRWS